MEIGYFDASALVKLLVKERGSGAAAAVWDDCDAAVSSCLAYPEVRAALAAASRNQDLDSQSLTSCQQRWEDMWSVIWSVELSTRVARVAGQLAERHRLRGADAVHLASALEIDAGDVTMAVWDRRLHAGARAENLAVAPRVLPGGL